MGDDQAGSASRRLGRSGVKMLWQADRALWGGGRRAGAGDTRSVSDQAGALRG